MKILLGREDVNPDKPDNEGRTPLSRAALYRHERVVALLQSRKAVSPPDDSSTEKRPLAEITPAASLPGHATRHDALEHHRPLPTGGLHEIRMQIYVIPSFVFLVIFLCGWAISELLFPKLF